MSTGRTEMHYSQEDKDKTMWPPPRSREVALFTDLTLYAETLALAQEHGTVTMASLQGQLKQRMQKMRLVWRQSKRTVGRLMRELRNFGWLQPRQKGQERVSTAPHVITPEGQRALNIARKDGREFRRLLTIKMHEIYVIPGWFVNRLWLINPEGQGEIVIPAPLPAWRLSTRRWEDHEWDTDLHRQTLEASGYVRRINPTAFPVNDEDWSSAVRTAWERLSALNPRRPPGHKAMSYSPRSRLALAMREASIKLLFDQIPYGQKHPDFPGEQPPIYLRTFMAWCPRLEALELLFYTDRHPQINGRLLFPTSVFRFTAPTSRFEQVREIIHPNGASLWLHQPEWDEIRTPFVQTLIEVHRRISKSSGSLYVSLLDVRDEVCRQLRLSSSCFDHLLEQTMRELPSEDFPWSIAAETDVREDQSGGAGQMRRPVYLQNVPHSLIALARPS